MPSPDSRPPVNLFYPPRPLILKRPWTPARRGIRIVIADTGTGMPDAVKARILEPFYTTKELHGTGLGMWISQEIVARHSGHISIRSSESAVRHGTVFSLFLPHCNDSGPDSPHQS